MRAGLRLANGMVLPDGAVLPAGHALAKKDSSRGGGMDIRTLAGETFVIPSPESSPGYVERLDQICAAADFHPASLRPVEGVENVLGLVAAGYGIAVLLEVLAAVAAPLCVTKSLRASVASFELELLWRRRGLTEVMQNFLAVGGRRAGNQEKTVRVVGGSRDR